MAYDEHLATRIEDQIGDHPAVTSRKMFGGIAYMLQGNMAVGIHNDGLMVRIPREEHDNAVNEPGVREFDMTGKRMRGWVVVDSATIADDQTLAQWIDRGMEFAGSLPPK